ncbi:conserved hypothetical protein [Thiomonas sp. CB3]|nr:conserved hypothetical protein [Thiomonas sp. CB3]
MSSVTPFSPPTKPALITAKSGDQAQCPQDIAAQVRRAWELQHQIALKKAELDAIKAVLLHIVPDGGSVVLPGECIATVANRSTVSIADTGTLRTVLGALWTECVTEETTYKPTPALIDLSADGDSPISGPIRDCLSVSASTTLTIKADRPQKPKTAAKKSPKKSA